jgi:predicted nucleic acid-binding protein
MATVYVLDTNVVSELMRERVDATVLERLSALDDTAWYITSVTEAELRDGVALLPSGRRKTRLTTALLALLSQEFSGRILVFDSAASVYYADAMALRSRMGRPLQVQDAMIAACCLVHGATLLTRNTREFEDLGVTLFNPWEAPVPPSSAARP